MPPPSGRAQIDPSWRTNGRLTARQQAPRTRRAVVQQPRRCRVPDPRSARGRRATSGPLALGGQKQRACSAAAGARGRGGLDRPARRRALGRAAAEDGDDVAPEHRLPAPQGCSAPTSLVTRPPGYVLEIEPDRSTSPASSGSSPSARRAAEERARTRARRSPSGAARRSPTSRSSRSRRARSAGSRSCGSRRSRSGSTPSSSSAGRRARRRARAARRHPLRERLGGS